MSAPPDIMPDRQEVLSSLYGAYRLACFDENGLTYFNITVEGFWRSFAAVLFVLPAYMLLIAQGISSSGLGLSVWAIVLYLTIEFVGWVIFALVALVVTDMLKLGHRYAALVIAVNWSQVIAIAAFVVGFELTALLPQDPADLLKVALITAIIIYQWFVIRTALQTTVAVALAFVLFSFVTGLMLEMTTSRLL